MIQAISLDLSLKPAEYLGIDELWHLELLEARSIWRDEHEAQMQKQLQAKATATG